MMIQVIGKQNLSPSVRRLDLRADALVAHLHPGQFVGVMPDRYSRCVPMNVYEVDFRRKCLTLVFEEADTETVKMGALRINDTLFSVSGPYGVPLPPAKVGTVLFVGEELGIASMISLCRTFKQTGNKVIGVAGFSSRRGSTLENQMRLNCSKFHVMYKDGANDRRGDVIVPLRKALAEEKPCRVYGHVGLQTMTDVFRCCSDAGVPLQVNVMDMLSVRPSFHETDSFLVNGEAFIPARDGIWADTSVIDINAFAREVDACKEYRQCRRTEAEQSASRSGWVRFKKFIWG